MIAERRPSAHGSDLSWTLTFFGAAVGAGILFLPVRAGMSGFWVTLVLALFIFPIIYFSHYLFASTILCTARPCDYTSAVRELLNQRIGSVVAVLFSMVMLMLLITYTTALNNSLGEFIVNHGLAQINPSRGPLLSLGILAAFLGVLRFGSRFVVRILGALSVMLILLLLAVSLLMADLWRFDIVFQMPKMAEMPKGFLLLFPIFIESFIFFPAVSSMVIAFRQEDGAPVEAKKRAARVIRHATLLLVVFTMVFVFSCLFALEPSQLTMAASQNLSVLDMLGTAGSPLLSELGPMVSILALATSFLGVFLGYRESVLRLMERYGFEAGKNIFFAGTFLVLWGFTSLNISVIAILGEVGGPLSALFLFLIPAWVHLQHRGLYQAHRWVLVFVLSAGVLQLVSYFLGSL